MNIRTFSQFFPKAAAFSCLLAGGASADILLIEDQIGFGPLEDNLRAAGYAVTVRNNEFANGYVNLLNEDFLDDFSLVIYGERGSGNGSVLPANVGTSLESYIQGGGNLLVTGWDALFAGQDATMASLVRATLPVAIVGNQSTWNVIANHPINNGPFGNFAGQPSFPASQYDVTLDADTVRGAVELVAAGDPRVTGRIIFTDLPGNGGSVGFWNGGSSGTTSNAQPDFTDGGQPTSIFRNYVAHTAGYPGLAGDDLMVSDSNADGIIVQELVGSIPAELPGTITSWNWSWDGGSATGQITEATFPVTNEALTVKLTVTTDGGLVVFDTFELTAFSQENGLFTEFRDPSYASVDPSASGSRLHATLKGDTLVIDPIGTGVPEVFRRVAGEWVASPFTAEVTDIRAVDENTLLSGTLSSATDFKIHRLVGGNWVESVVNLSPMALQQPPADSRFFPDFHPQAAIFPNAFDGGTGRTVVYDWVGNDWTGFELVPAGGLYPGRGWGEGAAVEGELAVITDRRFTEGDNLQIFKKVAGTWTHQSTRSPLTDAYFQGSVSIGAGVIAALTENTVEVIEFDAITSSWVQTELAVSPLVGFSAYFHVDMNDDGLAFVASDESGNHILYERDPNAASWASAVVTQRPLLTSDLFPDEDLLTTDFSGGKIVLSDPYIGIVRIFDKNAPFDGVNAEPIAAADSEISTTSFDGQPVAVFLNGGATRDFNFGETFEAGWSWTWMDGAAMQSGSASGLQTVAILDPRVTSVTLKVKDSRGAFSTISIPVDIDAPPVIAAGEDVVVADSDGDGLIQVNVSGSAAPHEYPIVSWNWRWAGGSFSGQSGILNLGRAAHGKDVTLEVTDSNGLTSESTFRFTLLEADPVPTILEAADGGPLARYGDSVAIDDGLALIGSPGKLTGSVTTGATYATQNFNNLWPQTSLAPGTLQGDAVLVEDGFAFVGAKRRGSGSAPGSGRVVVYERQGGMWVQDQILAPSDAGADFGDSIAKSGDRLLVGAPGSGGGGYLFEFNGSSWAQVFKFNDPSPTFGKFGSNVAIRGDSVAMTRPGFSEASLVAVFKASGGIWPATPSVVFQADVPQPPQSNDNYHFGQALAMNDTELLIGSPVEDAVYHYSLSEGVWVENQEPKLDSGTTYYFGSSLALKGNSLAVGSVNDGSGTGGIPRPGSVTTFILEDGVWRRTGFLRPDESLGPFVFGLNKNPDYAFSIDHDGRDLIVGAPRARSAGNVEKGKALIYRNLAGLDPDVNYEPLANAGEDIQVTDDGDIDDPDRVPPYRDSITNALNEWPGSEEVTLNASASTDEENAIVSHVWTWPGGTASGVTANVRFPVGTTVVTLTVTDDKGIVHSDTVNVIVTQEQISPTALPTTTGNTLTVNLPVPGAKWRLSSEFEWHPSGHTLTEGIVANATYRLEILPYLGSPDILSEVVQTEVDGTTTLNPSMDAPSLPVEEGIIGFPENAEGFGWRLVGETAFRNVVENNDSTADFSEISLPLGSYNIEFLPVAGFATPPSRLVNVVAGTTRFTSSGYQQLASYNAAKTFVEVDPPQQLNAPYQFTGMIRTRLGRGSGTAVAERVVLTAAHLFFDENGLAFQEVEWFPQQQEGAHQAPPLAPRGILFRTSYAKLVAPNTVPDGVENLPDDDQEVDYAVLYFSTDDAWPGGEAGFLESTSDKNWLTGTEPKRAVAYPQRSQPFPMRGRLFEKDLLFPLTPLDANAPARLNSSDELSGDGGASGSALFVQPTGTSKSYPAAILLAGQGRAVYRIIDQDVTRMIRDGEDAASGNDEVLDNNSSLVGFGGLGGFTTLAVDITPAQTLTTARWSITPDVGNAFTNLMPGAKVAFNSNWQSFTVSFSSVPGYAPPQPLFYLKKQVNAGAANTYSVVYQALTGYELWKQSQGITNDSDDRDGDGKNALAEYAINGNINSGSDPAPIRMAAVPLQNTHAEFEVYVSSAADKIRYTVKASNTLPPTNIVTLATFPRVGAVNGYNLVTDSQPKSASPKRFAWVEYTHDRNLPAPE